MCNSINKNLVYLFLKSRKLGILYEKAAKYEKIISHLFSLSSVNFVAFAEKLVFNVFLLLRAGTLICSMNKKSCLENRNF